MQAHHCATSSCENVQPQGVGPHDNCIDTIAKGRSGAALGPQETADQSAPAQKLGARDIAKLFTTGRDTLPEKRITPAILNDREQQDIARLSSLRGALYAKD